MENFSKVLKILLDRFDAMTNFEHIMFCTMLVFMALTVDKFILYSFPGFTLFFSIFFIFSTCLKIYHNHIVKRGYEEWGKDKFKW